MYFRLLLISLIIGLSSTSSKYSKLLVVSFDGFRFDYLNLNITPTLNSLKSSSSYAKCLLNIFPTQTFPNHFSIATGLYSEVHGVLGSKVYDSKTKTLLEKGYELWHYNDDILPIWSLNEKACPDRHSGVMMWPGSEFAFSGINATFIQKYEKEMPWKKRVDTGIGWFVDERTPANLVMMYFEEPDAVEHAFGPNSPETLDQIRNVDRIAKNILDSLTNNNLTNVNVIFLSDHGMESITRERIIDLRPLVGDLADMYGTSPILQLYPKPGANITEIFNKLDTFASKNKNFNVYLKSKIPEHLHVKNCERTPPILVLAEPKYGFQDVSDAIDWFVKYENATENGTYGIHGYDPQTVSMHPYFIAHGPLFKENHFAGEVRTVDLYPLFTHALQLQLPELKPNGTFDGVASLFKPQSPKNLLVYAYIFYVFVIAVLGIFIMSAFCMRRRKIVSCNNQKMPVEDVEVEEKLLQCNNED